MTDMWTDIALPLEEDSNDAKAREAETGSQTSVWYLGLETEVSAQHWYAQVHTNVDHAMLCGVCVSAESAL